MSARTCPLSCADRSRADVELELGFEQFGDELLTEPGVHHALGGQRAGGRLELGVEEFVDGGAEHELQIGREVPGVRELPGGAARGLARLLAQVQEGFEEHIGLGGPPAVDGLLADARAGGDALDGGALVADLGDGGERGVVDGVAGALTAAAGVGPVLAGGAGGRVGAVGVLESLDMHRIYLVTRRSVFIRLTRRIVLPNVWCGRYGAYRPVGRRPTDDDHHTEVRAYGPQRKHARRGRHPQQSLAGRAARRGRDGRGAAVDPAAQKRELLRKLQAARTAEQDASGDTSAATSGSAPDAGPGPATDEDTTATDGS